MDFEAIIYFYLPIAIGLLEIIYSIYLTLKRKNAFNFVSSLGIVVFNLLAIYILIRILLKAWPTYLPHLLILISTIIFLIQLLTKKRIKNGCQHHV